MINPAVSCEAKHVCLAVFMATKSDKAPQEHFVALDSWRGICAILVAMYHLQALAHVYQLPLIRHAFLFVDFFFVLSGFVITHAYTGRIGTFSDFRSFAIKRLGRIWPLHIVVLVAFVGAEALNLALSIAVGLKTGRPPFDPEGFRPLATIPYQFFLLQSLHVSDRLTWNFPSWSISAEFWTYLVFGLIALLAPMRKTLAMSLVGLAGFLVVGTFASGGIDVTYDLGLFRCLFGFAVGHGVYRLYRSGLRLGPAGAGIVEAIMVLIGAFVWFAGNGPFSLFGPFVFGAAVLVFAAEQGALSRALRWRPVVRLGELSYSVYMVHAFIVQLVMTAMIMLQKIAGKPLLIDMVQQGETTRVIANINSFLLDGLFVVYAIAIVGLSTLTYRFVEVPGKLLFARWADRLARRDVATQPVVTRLASEQS